LTAWGRRGKLRRAAAARKLKKRGYIRPTGGGSGRGTGRNGKELRQMPLGKKMEGFLHATVFVEEKGKSAGGKQKRALTVRGGGTGSRLKTPVDIQMRGRRNQIRLQGKKYPYVAGARGRPKRGAWYGKEVKGVGGLATALPRLRSWGELGCGRERSGRR